MDSESHVDSACLEYKRSSWKRVEWGREVNGQGKNKNLRAFLIIMWKPIGIFGWDFTCHMLKLIYDRQSVGQSVLVSGAHLGTSDQFFFLLEISFKQLRVCYFVAFSLTRGRVCNLLYNCFWALPEQSFFCRSPAELTAIFYCLIWDSPNLEGQVPVFKPPRNEVAQIYPRALGFRFVASYDLQGYGEGILTRLHTGLRISTTKSTDTSIILEADTISSDQVDTKSELKSTLSMF
jgi:hypothetical protein